MTYEEMASLTCAIAQTSTEKTKVGYTEWVRVYDSYVCIYKGKNYVLPNGTIQHAEVPYQYNKDIEEGRRKLVHHVDGSALSFVTKFPCEHCALWLVRKGIKLLFTPSWYTVNPRTGELSKWVDSQKKAEKLFLENGVKIIHMNIEYNDNGEPQFHGFF